MTGKRGTPIPVEALAYIRSKKISTGFDHRDVWREAHATAFTVAKAMQIDVLESIRDALDQALAEGRTFRDFQKDLTPILQRLGWWGKSEEVDPLTGDTREVQLGSPRRLKTIYDTNMTIAYQSGQWQRIQRSKKSLPYLKYVLGPSKEHRAEHVQWAGTILPVDHPFWKTHRPKNGWGCNCDVVAISNAQAKREGISEAPPIEMRKWENARTGEVTNVPVGIDPGWDFNPGQVTHDEYASQIFGAKIKTASAEIGSLAMASAGSYVRAAMRNDYRRWLTLRLSQASESFGGEQLVSVVQADVIYALRKQGLVLDSAGIKMKDRFVRHLVGKEHSLQESELLTLADRLDNPKAVFLDALGRVLVYVFDLPSGKLGKVTIQPGATVAEGLQRTKAPIHSNTIIAFDAIGPVDMPVERYELITGA